MLMLREESYKTMRKFNADAEKGELKEGEEIKC